MSTKKLTNVAFSERLLKIIAEKAQGKPTIFARMAGISSGSIFNYVEGRMPSPENLTHICEAFAVNMNWLLTGKGDPYIEEIQEGLASEPKHVYNLPEPDLGGEDAPQPSQTDTVLDLAREVLTSDNRQAADALEKNIRYFAHAIRMEERLADLEGKFERLEYFLKRFGMGGPDQKESSTG